MNFNNIVVFDFETGSKRSFFTQPTQLSAAIVNGRKLELIDGAIFNSYIKPIIDEEELKKTKLDKIEDEALKVTGITWDKLNSAPSIKVVWANFVEFMKQYNPDGKQWSAPLASGYNIHNFDMNIINRIAGGHTRFVKADKEPYGFGPFDEEYYQCTLFHPIHKIDLMNIVWNWTENNKDIRSISFDSVRKWVGMSLEGGHDAKTDVLQSVELLIRFMRLTRITSRKVKFKDSFNEAYTKN